MDKTQYTDDLPSDDNFLEYGDILFSHINSFDHLAKTAIYLGNNKSVIHGINLIKLKPNKCIINPAYLSYILKSDEFVNIAKKLGQRAVNQASIRVSKLRKLSIPVPSLLEQQEIVERLEQERKMIDSQKEIIKLSEAKIQSTLNALWQPEEENEPVANKATFDTLIKAASKPLQS
ncbi:MAG: restriction endonuclease subunit S [Rickettsia endosymbiont of Labidopullus appendiculatus]|nr:restriction endonuclease subunit S [Rickettsia endosymbiont of Labidopullus appendiculatus]